MVVCDWEKGMFASDSNLLQCYLTLWEGIDEEDCDINSVELSAYLMTMDDIVRHYCDIYKKSAKRHEVVLDSLLSKGYNIFTAFWGRMS